jgi:tight adherence protein C
MTLDGIALTASVLLVSTLGAIVAAFVAFARRDQVVERRLKIEATGSEAEPGGRSTLATTVSALLKPVARIARPAREEELSRIRLQLVRAGYRQAYALQAFLASKVLLSLASGVTFVVLNVHRVQPLEPAPLLSVIMFALGYYTPTVWLAGRVRARQVSIERGLPDALDLLVTCVEAGLGLEAALQRVSREVGRAWPTLGEELQLTVLEANAGIARTETFRRLADRTGASELKSLAATLAQTEMFGTSIAIALRVQAEGIRSRRMYRAEERAGYVSVKMALPLIFCILPTLFALVVGPAIIRLSQTVFPYIAGRR